MTRMICRMLSQSIATTKSIIFTLSTAIMMLRLTLAIANPEAHPSPEESLQSRCDATGCDWWSLRYVAIVLLKSVASS